MAAGLGFKTFTTGEVLTAADTNGYLMQGVLVFASSAARAAAITSPQEGQYSYLKDTNSTEYYDGAAWVAAPIGDITGVTAGTGISGGGTSGTVTITNSMATEIAAKGDLIVGTGAATFDNLTVGANGTTLVADSSQASGLKWATPSGSSGPAFRATPGSTIQTGVSAGVFTKVTLGTETFDTASNFASSRFTPTTAGYYQFNTTADMISTTLPNQYMGRLYINGAAVNIFACYEGATTSADGQWIGSGSEVYYMNGTTDYAELYAYVGGGTVSFGVQSRFSGVWIRS